VYDIYALARKSERRTSQPIMDLLRVEQQRQALEENLQKLRQSLRYWQTFEAEYEGLKEEIQEAQPNVDKAKLEEISKSYDGEVVTEKVIRELAGLDKGSPRTGQQIIRDIERRQEYVQKNSETIQRRFFEAEAKLEEFDFAATRDSETGLPLTEILEELDDDDNVISSTLSQPEAQQSKLVETLRKAGLSEEDLAAGGESEKPLKPAITNANPLISASPSTPLMEKRASKSTSDIPHSTGDATDDHEGPDRPPLRKKSVSFAADTKAAPEVVRIDSEDGKKSVSFAEKVAVAPAAPPPDTRTVQFSPTVEEIPAAPVAPASLEMSTKAGASQADSTTQKELRNSFKPGNRVVTIGDDDEVVDDQFVLPEDEPEEDAQTRREMLNYHLNEVGHIVAEINIDQGDGDEYNDDEDDDDETSSHFTGSTYQDDEDTPYTSGLSDEEEEDEHGRSRGKVISENYRKEMLALQERLIGNMGPAPKDEELEDVDPEINPADVRRLVIRDNRNSVSSVSSENSDKKSKKRVSFAESLDVAEPETTLLKALKSLEGQNAAPVSDEVAERTAESKSVQPPAPAKVSKFKKARAAPSEDTAFADPLNLDGAADLDDAPTSPPGKILADNLIERPATTKSTAAPSEDDLDPVAERRQLAAEYYRRRNEMVRQQGGFKVNRDEDEEMGELMEERPDGKLKKVSRFKAARIKP
jgi:unconventional prefoldin RPB5 interactor 1